MIRNLMLRSALTLGICSFVAIGAIAMVNATTRSRIQEARLALVLDSLSAVLPDVPFDNDPVSSAKWLLAPELGSIEAIPVYPVFRDQKPLAAVLSVVAPDGYSGEIHLLLGIDFDGTIIGARVTEHSETPGLGDDIDIRKSDWIFQFRNQSLSASNNEDWAVRGYGGQYDALTGATITPSAVITAIHRALRWYDLNRDLVYSS